eukprot:NODE_299_length_10456_cov_1.003669.p7 type:complete len:196 gc:universal NODE_299_length_10456_cov_1.003669:2229-1642(-)
MNAQDSAIKIIQSVLHTKYILSFNGGKDCTVLLDLISKCTKSKIPLLYIKTPDTFPELEEFIFKCCDNYNVILYTLSCTSIKVGLREFLKVHSFETCFVGTRFTDPHGSNMQIVQMTDNGWPGILRVNPILQWNLSDIWNYLLRNEIEYCKLYNMGYSSIGHASKTKKNPNLFVNGEYIPAYKLLVDGQERFGRQ